jgi:hypothetical protein
MRTKTVLGIVGLASGAMLAVVLLLASGGSTGEYHSGQALLCYDCHTIHFSMQHGWDSNNPVQTTPPTSGNTGNWLGTTGPNVHLLKMPANELCLACHNAQAIAPDVLADNANAMPQNGRSAGALNDATVGAPYDIWKGHTLSSTADPPGYDPAKVGAPVNWYNASNGLECTSCHAQHGPASAYRNLGPYALGASASSARPLYGFNVGTPPTVCRNTTNTPCDVWINLASYTAGSGVAATFNPFYATANIFYLRNDVTVGQVTTSNRMGTFCGTCHGNFHGGLGNANIGGTPLNAGGTGFLRHPTSGITIGGTGAGGQSLLSGAGYAPGITKVKVFTNDYTNFTNSSPGCITCHKSHGNQNPFGLIFLGQNATAVTEEGGYNAGQTQDLPTGLRNLCGQCHTQGN